MIFWGDIQCEVDRVPLPFVFGKWVTALHKLTFRHNVFPLQWDSEFKPTYVYSKVSQQVAFGCWCKWMQRLVHFYKLFYTMSSRWVVVFFELVIQPNALRMNNTQRPFFFFFLKNHKQNTQKVHDRLVFRAASPTKLPKPSEFSSSVALKMKA